MSELSTYRFSSSYDCYCHNYVLPTNPQQTWLRLRGMTHGCRPRSTFSIASILTPSTCGCILMSVWNILWQDMTWAGSASTKLVWCSFSPPEERSACIPAHGPSEQEYLSVPEWEFEIVVEASEARMACNEKNEVMEWQPHKSRSSSRRICRRIRSLDGRRALEMKSRLLFQSRIPAGKACIDTDGWGYAKNTQMVM